MNLSTEIVRELLEYSPSTGVFVWRERGREWFSRKQDWERWNNRYPGRAAGCVDKNARGYPELRISVLSNLHLASRLAFTWMGEPLPEQVDHDDGDSLNNRWANLKPSTNAENGKNRSLSRANSSGVTGVCWNKAKGKWQAQVKLNGKLRYPGYFDDLDEAEAAVSEFRAANGFSERHGQGFAAYQIATNQ